MVAASVQEIVYAFLQTYYQRMKSNPSKLSNLYSSTAELTHINYTQITPSDIHQSISNDNDNNNNNSTIDMIPTIKLTGKDNINKFFTRHENKVNKLKVKLDTCDFQTMGASHKNILVVVTGELFWDGTPSYQFCQTFILIPISKNSDIYDISNDIIRFIPDTFKQIHLINEENATPKIGVKEKPQVTQIDNAKTSQNSISSSIRKENMIVDEKQNDDIISENSVKSDRENNKIEANQQQSEDKQSLSQNTVSSSSLHTDSKESIAKQIIEPSDFDKQRSESTTREQEEKHTTDKHEKEAPTKKDQEIVVEKKEPATAEEIKQPSTANTNETESSTDEKESDNFESLSSSTSSTTVSQFQTPQPVKLSWASKLSSAELTKESKKILVAKTTAATKIVIPETSSSQHQHHHNQHKNNSGNNKKATGKDDKRFEMGSRKDNASNRRDRRKQQNSTGANKEGYYPVYVNGTYGIDDETLKNALTNAFGTVVKINSGENFAVVDFQTYSSQVSALEMRKMMVEGYEISIERKTSKKGNLQHNSSNRTTSPDGFISSTKSHRKYQNNNNNSKKRDSGNY